MNKVPDYIKDLAEIGIAITSANGVRVNEHSHDFLELAYVANGTVTHRICNSERILSQGDYLIIDYDTAHEYHSADGKRIEIINCLFLPKLIDRSLAYCRSFNSLLRNYLIKISAEDLAINPSNYIFHDDDGSVAKHLLFMKGECAEQNMGYIEVMRSRLIELIIHTMRKAGASEARPFHDELANTVLRYAENNYVSGRTLSELAETLHYSVSYLSRCFREAAGVGYSEYTQNLRLENAARLIANTNKRVSEIAAFSGYRDTDFFLKVFKRKFGVSPSQFRKTLVK